MFWKFNLCTGNEKLLEFIHESPELNSRTMQFKKSVIFKDISRCFLV